MQAETRNDGFGWMPYEGFGATPIYFEGEELPGGAPAPDASPSVEPTPDGPPAVEAPGGGAPIADAPPPWEGKTPEELWDLNAKLKDENTSFKERFRPWEEVTAGLDPEDVTFYRDFLGAVKTGDQDKLSKLGPAMREVLDRLSPAQQQAAIAEMEQAQEEFDPFNPEHIDRRIEERAKAMLDAREKEQTEKQAIEKAQREMNDHLAGLAKPDADGGVGIPGLGDPTSPDYATVLWMAERNPELKSIGDPMERLTKAAQQYRDHLDERAQALLKSKSAADAAPASSPDGHTPSGTRTPKDWKEARDSALARVTKLDLGSEQSVGT